MNAASRKRVRDAQRNAQKKRHRRFMIRRITAVIICILILVLIIFGIRGCKKTNNSDAPVVTVIPGITLPPQGAVSAIPVGDVTRDDIDQSYFNNSCFVGNSVIEGMGVYELLDNADYFAKIGLNVSDASKLAMDSSNIPVIDELNNSSKSYGKIFMMFGENELSWSNIDTFKSDYAALIKKAKIYQPSAQIYLLSITPISKAVDSEPSDGVTKSAILEFNEYIKEIAEQNSAVYVDLFTALADDEGFLPEGVATDGIHFGIDYYTKCLVYIQQNYK